jgi:lysophospholipase L1-like esterase
MRFQNGQRLVFIGDSITDCGRREKNPPYGDGYFNLLRALVTARHPELHLTWINQGINGDTVRQLAERWDHDAIGQRPDWLSVMIGINDVWRAFDGREDEAVPLGEFTDTLSTLLRRAVDETGCRLIIADPFIIEPSTTDPHRLASDQYVKVITDLAAEFSAVHVRVQAAFDHVLTVTPAENWATDRIHPALPGHAVIANAYLDAMQS